MKKALAIIVALLALVAFTGGVMAQEKKEAPAPAPAAEKPKAPKILKATGAVVAYEAGKTIKIKVKNKEMAFDIAPDAKIKGEVKEGATATISYKKEADKMVATAITVAAPKKPAAKKPVEKKEEEKKPEEKK